jgi:ATP-dependent DNA helicase PIF1
VGRSRLASQRWKECQILVIDEISMLSAELFDKLSFIGSRVRNDPRPFGGLQLVLCGDFYQLPPIGVGKNSMFCFQSKNWQNIFGTFCHGCFVAVFRPLSMQLFSLFL